MRWGTSLLGLILLLPGAALAHRDDYIDETFVYMTLEGGARELELWAEARDTQAHKTEGWYTAAFELGMTPRWTLDAASQVAHKGNGFEFGRLRTETRYRFAGEGDWLLDVAASLEYELETRAATEGRAEQALTPRLVLSKDLTPNLNTTLNLDAPLSLTDGELSFAYALGTRYPAEGLLRFGAELKGQPSAHTATLFPQVWFALPSETTFKLGTGIGLTDHTDRLVVRGVLEIEF